MLPSKRFYTREEWEIRTKDVKIRKDSMNKLVMDFLVTEGYNEAAHKFSDESETEFNEDFDFLMAERAHVKKAVKFGPVKNSIDLIKALGPEILEDNPQLNFYLQQQKLIELILSGKAEEALKFAELELAPVAKMNNFFLEELEKTVALLLFDLRCKELPYSELLDGSRLLKIASEVNAAILINQDREKDPKLYRLLQLLQWNQLLLAQQAAFPWVLDFYTAILEEPLI